MVKEFLADNSQSNSDGGVVGHKPVRQSWLCAEQSESEAEGGGSWPVYSNR